MVSHGFFEFTGLSWNIPICRIKVGYQMLTWDPSLEMQVSMVDTKKILISNPARMPKEFLTTLRGCDSQ